MHLKMALDLIVEFPVLAALVKQAGQPEHQFAKSWEFLIHNEGQPSDRRGMRGGQEASRQASRPRRAKAEPSPRWRDQLRQRRREISASTGPGPGRKRGRRQGQW